LSWPLPGIGTPSALRCRIHKRCSNGVTVAFVQIANTKIELLEPLGEASPIAAFLTKHPDGGMHHICYEVTDILAARDHLVAAGARALAGGIPRMGAHGKPVLFLHPKDFFGTPIELEEKNREVAGDSLLICASAPVRGQRGRLPFE
jgi:methylmalonyl-CoA/ethylmalonyl-CoA epimerase